jgi:hypothetical protein
MAAYNPRNFDLGQFMNDLFLQSDLSAQFQFLGNHLQVVNAYASAMEQELTRVTAIATTAQAQIQAQPGILLQTHINFPRFLPIFPDFLERLSHLAPIY